VSMRTPQTCHIWSASGVFSEEESSFKQGWDGRLACSSAPSRFSVVMI